MDATGSCTAETRRTGNVLLLVGRGRYEDRWHDGAAVGHRVAGIAQELGLTPEVRGTFPDALDGMVPEDVDLLVVTAGHGRTDTEFDGDDAAWVPFHTRLAELVTAGLPVLALHQAAMTFGDSPTWAMQLGGRWVDGRSMHPPLGESAFRSAQPSHPVTTGLAVVEAYDERYCFLEVDPRSQVLLTTQHDGLEHAVAWVAPGPGHVVYDGLGHDVRSFDSPSRRQFLRREISWLLTLSQPGAPIDPPRLTRSNA